jgi:D-inositol-3-phosphate glycosyltransferase
MNVAIISYHTCPLATLGGKHTGGMNVYIRDLTKYLGEFGIHADVFTRSENEHVPHVLHALGCGNRVIHIPAGPEYPIEKNKLPNYIEEFTNGILQFSQSKSIEYDIIHSHYWMSGIAANSLKKTWGSPIIQMFHTLALLKNKVAHNESELDNTQRIQGEEELMINADRIIASTIDEKKELVNLYKTKKEKIVVIPPGVDTSRFYPIPPEEAKEFINIPEDENMLLFVGRIEPLKGIDTLIQAIAQLRKADVMENCPHYLYIIGGDLEEDDRNLNQEMMRLQKLCEDYGLGDLIVFLGKKDQNTLQYYYSAAEIVVMPSNYESFGMVALEAMACGTPVVATQVGGLQHLVQDGVTGFTVPNNDPTALEEKITMLLCQSELRQRLSNASVQYARTFDWDMIIPRITAIYEELLKGKQFF